MEITVTEKEINNDNDKTIAGTKKTWLSLSPEHQKFLKSIWNNATIQKFNGNHIAKELNELGFVSVKFGCIFLTVNGDYLRMIGGLK